MTAVFSAKLRKLGNSLAVIVPSKIAREMGTREGDEVKVSVMKKDSKGRTALLQYAGSHLGSKPFKREEGKDRI